MARKAKFVEMWERQPNEQAKQFKAFCLYRDMNPGDQTMKRLSAMTGVSERTLAMWKKDFKWEERSQAWADEEDRQAREKHLKALDEMHERHIAVSMRVLEKVEDALDVLDAEMIMAKDIPKLIEVAAKLERLSRGDAGDSVEVRDGGKAVNPVTFYLPNNHRDAEGEDEEVMPDDD